jgi:hypothetical protein
MNPQPIDRSAYWANYVEVMAALHGFALDAGRRAEIIAQLERIALMAQQLEDFPLPAEIEPAPVFRP